MVRLKRKNVSVHRSLIAPMMLIATLACGCKSSSWMARPSWLGGSPPPASSLSSAPAFDKGIAKPSETAKPYPTTNTPEGYVLNNGTRTDSPSATASTATAVTYGATPPPAPTATAAAPSIAPQVGPYAPLQRTPATSPPSDPAAAVTSGFAAAPAFAGGNAAPPASPAPPAGARFADASGGTAGWSPSSSPTPAAAPPSSPGMSAFPPPSQPAPADARYGNVTSSRFATGFQPPQSPPSTEPQPQWSAPPPAAPPTPVSPPPSSTPEAALPGSIAPPTRRPDPGYRPGGTSSYRPAKTLLAGEDEDSGVQPVSFESAPQ
jgi:hypothetical protein